MKIPICIVSFNRSLYLESLLYSLNSELQDFNVVIVDNNSKELNMQNVFDRWSNKVTILKLAGDDWINDEYKAKNAFLDHCKKNYSSSEYCLFLQDDMQYVGPKTKLRSITDSLNDTEFLNISLTGVRKSTIKSTYSTIRRANVWQTKDNHFMTTGLYKNSVFERVGKYQQDYPMNKEYWGRGEDDYNARVNLEYSQYKLITGCSHVPLFVGVWNDPRGHYSFLRDGKRYGKYEAPISPHKTYYENLSQAQFANLLMKNEPAGFVDVAIPLGWQYACTADGDQEKYPQSKIMLEGPVGEIL